MRFPQLRPIAATLIAGLFLAPARAADDEPLTYERDIKPLLVKRCTVCHSARQLDKEDVSGGLALDTFAGLMAGTKGRAIVVPGKSSESELVRRLTDPDEDRRMPLSDKILAESDRKRLARWVDTGATQGLPSASSVGSQASSSTGKRRLARTLDVVVPIETRIPSGIQGIAAGGPVQLAVQVGPLPSVTSLAFRGDGRLLAVGTYGAVILWDLAEGRPARILGEIPGPVHALAFSRDGRRLAVGSGLPARAGVVRIYDVPGGTLIHDFEGHSDVVVGVAFRPDGGQLASASFDQTVRLWNLAIGRSEGVFRGHSDFVYDVAYDRDGRSIFSVSKDRSIKRFDVARVKELRTYSEHNDDILAVAVPPTGTEFVSAGHEPQIRWWPVEGEKSARRLGGHGGPVFQLAFSADGSKLISAGGDGSVRLWSGQSGSTQKVLLTNAEWQYAAALSADATLAAAGGWDGLVRVWETSSGKLRATLIQPPAESPGPSI
ncbi:MAG: c-type cytochrome domain-containing protein [Isosphaeraceae bacterium]